MIYLKKSSFARAVNAEKVQLGPTAPQLGEVTEDEWRKSATVYTNRRRAGFPPNGGLFSEANCHSE